jgi:hypothetical protein
VLQGRGAVAKAGRAAAAQDERGQKRPHSAIAVGRRLGGAHRRLRRSGKSIGACPSILIGATKVTRPLDRLLPLAARMVGYVPRKGGGAFFEDPRYSDVAEGLRRPLHVTRPLAPANGQTAV